MATILRWKGLIAAALVAGVIVLAVVVRWHGESNVPPVTGPRATMGVDGGPTQLEAWRRPSTTDPKVYATAYGTAIWTYDTGRHGYFDWQDAVKLFADPMDSGGPRIAASMLPDFGQWEQLELHGSKAAAARVTAVTTPELVKLESGPQTPPGWHGFVVRGQQDVEVDGQLRVAQRSVTVAVVCRPECRFWSATTEGPL